MNCFPEKTVKDRFEDPFLLSIRFRGQICNSIDEIADIMAKQYPELPFFNYQLNPVVSDKFDFVSVPFGYVTADVGSARFHNEEYLGFKLDSEPFYRLGPPHLEPSRETACVGTVKGHRLYESPEKKNELLSHSDL